MGKRYRQHVNPLKMTCLIPRQAVELPPDKLVEVELGCGDAAFLIARAGAYPERFFLGLDIREEFMAIGQAHIAELALQNIRLEASNLIVDADRLFPPERIHRFYINFPDPYFKARQHSRRWLKKTTLRHLIHTLLPGGEIFFQSDVWDIAIEAFALLEGEDTLTNLHGPWTFQRENTYGISSSREDACLKEQRKIWRMLFARRR